MSIVHGTLAGYTVLHCRCALCSAAERAYQLEYRALPRVKERGRVRSRQQYKDDKSNRVCVGCGKSTPELGRARCVRCLDKTRKSANRYYVKRKANNLCGACGGPRDVDNNYISCSSCRSKHRELTATAKVDAMNAYGGCACACCGETTLDFLSIDHVNGGGRKHRQTIKSNFYEWLNRNKYPSGYQVLCLHCNYAKYLHGACPYHVAL